MHAEFGGVNSIFTYYTRHNIWGFLSIAQNYCQKSPRIHLRKKMCVNIQVQLKKFLPCGITYCPF